MIGNRSGIWADRAVVGGVAALLLLAGVVVWLRAERPPAAMRAVARYHVDASTTIPAVDRGAGDVARGFADLPLEALPATSLLAPSPAPPLLPSGAGFRISAADPGTPVRLELDGRTTTVELDAGAGALCSTAAEGTRRCVGGAVRFECGPDASCRAPDRILAAAGDVVVSDWTVDHTEPRPDRTRIWRITDTGPVPLVELDAALDAAFDATLAGSESDAAPAIAIDRATDAVELAVAGPDGWQIVRCGAAGACRRSPSATRPAGRSALDAAPAADLAPDAGWPAGATLTLDSCTAQWPPALDVQGTVNGTTGDATPAALLVVHVFRPDGATATVPVDVTMAGDGPFSFVLPDPPLGPITEPAALRDLLAGGTCQLATTDAAGTWALRDAPIGLV